MGKAGVGGASGVPPFLLFPFGAFRSAPSGKGRSLGAPREPSRAGGLGRGRQVSPSRAGCAGAGACRGPFRLRFGELPATKRRRLRRPFVTKFAVSSPFAAGGFFFLITREGALAGGFCPQRPGAGAAPTSPLCRGEVRHFAVRKSPARHFAALPWRSPTKPPGFPTSPWQSSPLCSAKVHQATRFFTSPRESRWPHFAALPC